MALPKYKMNIVVSVEINNRLPLKRLKEIFHGRIARGEAIDTTMSKIKIRETFFSQIKYGIQWRRYCLAGHIRGYFDRKTTQDALPSAIFSFVAGVIILVIGYFVGKL